jgi:hypothetical protein
MRCRVKLNTEPITVTIQNTLKHQQQQLYDRAIAAASLKALALCQPYYLVRSYAIHRVRCLAMTVLLFLMETTSDVIRKCRCQ